MYTVGYYSNSVIQETRLWPHSIGILKRLLKGKFLFFLGIGIKAVLSFITGSPLLPNELTVGFLANEKGFSLPDPDVCSNSLKIPTCHTTYDMFQTAFDATVRVQGKGYGRA